MKNFKIVAIALIALVTVSNLNAQDKNNLWAVGFGVNVVDFSDFANDTAEWNLLSSVSRVSIEKYVKSGFTLQFAGAMNRIETDGTYTGDVRNKVDELYWSVGGTVKYDIDIVEIWGETFQLFDPYVFVGGGYVNYADASEGMMHVGVGFNSWVNENLGFNFQYGRKKGFSEEVADHNQLSLGLVYRFGEKKTDSNN